jgi:Family of unknown function (DUF6194)
MDQDQIRRYVTDSFADVDVQVAEPGDGSPEIAWGDTFFIHHEDKQRFPFATIVTKDYTGFDEQSDLDRPDVFRLNIGLSKLTFDRLFGAGGEHDFTALDVLMPHPVYGVNRFVCVLNPSDETFETIKPLLAEAYAIAERRAGRRSQV